MNAFIQSDIQLRKQSRGSNSKITLPTVRVLPVTFQKQIQHPLPQSHSLPQQERFFYLEHQEATFNNIVR